MTDSSAILSTLAASFARVVAAASPGPAQEALVLFGHDMHQAIERFTQRDNDWTARMDTLESMRSELRASSALTQREYHQLASQFDRLSARLHKMSDAQIGQDMRYLGLLDWLLLVVAIAPGSPSPPNPFTVYHDDESDV